MYKKSTENMKVNLFMTYDDISEYILVMLDKHELTVKVLYYKGKDVEISLINAEKFEIVENFAASNLEDAEHKYSEWNNVSVIVPMISEYLTRRNS